MSKKVKQSISIFCLIIMLIGFIYIGGKEYKKETNLSDAEKFSLEYPTIPSDNVFNYLDSNELLTFLSDGTGILFIANPNSIYSEYYAKYLNEIAQTTDIKTVNYYNIAKAKESQNRFYKALIEKLDKHLITTDNNSQNLFTPMTIFLRKGQVIAVDNTTAVINQNILPEDYWTSENISTFQINILNNYLAI